MGLPGSGKTFLSKELKKIIPIIHLNADEIRKHFNDWDFSKEGRLRQADRMKRFSDYIYLRESFNILIYVRSNYKQYT